MELRADLLHIRPEPWSEFSLTRRCWANRRACMMKLNVAFAFVSSKGWISTGCWCTFPMTTFTRSSSPTCWSWSERWTPRLVTSVYFAVVPLAPVVYSIQPVLNHYKKLCKNSLDGMRQKGEAGEIWNWSLLGVKGFKCSQFTSCRVTASWRCPQGRARQFPSCPWLLLTCW